MPIGLRRVVEIALPLVIAYAFFGAPLPAFVQELLSSEGASTPIHFSPENLEWAIDTLALPSEHQHTACSEHDYKTHVFSRDPLVIYLENFLSREEVADLLKLR